LCAKFETIFQKKGLPSEMKVVSLEPGELGICHLLSSLNLAPSNSEARRLIQGGAVLVLEGESVVSNTVEMEGKKRILMLSGPNAGGKTVLLKTIGLAAHMSACGLHICADKSSKIPFFKEIHVAVGDQQNISSHLSTFAAHLKVLDKACKAKGYDKLLLIDEICGSTDPEEGGALARSFIDVYLENKVFGVITSHLSYLKSGWESSSGLINGSLEYDEKKSKPLYRFVMGIAGKSLALKIAKNAGISDSLLKKAISFLSPEAKEDHKRQQEDLKIKKDMEALKRNLKEEIKLYEKKRKDYEDSLKTLQEERLEVVEKERKKAREEMNELISKAKAENVLTNYKNLQKMKESIPKVITSHENQGEVLSKEDFEKKLKPGTKVFVSSLNRTGVVQSTMNKKGEVEVLSQSLRLSVLWTDLQMTEPSYDRGSSFQKRNFTQSSVNKDNTLDLRGYSVEEALESLEKKIDEALLKEVDRVKIVHGHGGEVLKRAIRSYLSKSLHIKKWMASSKETGGDGVTWIEF